MKNEARRKTVLKIACAAGSLLLLIFGGLCVGTSIFSRNSVFKTERNEGPSNFYQKLRLFDDVLALSGASPNHSHIGNLLEELDKSASGAEARLLFLKRYRKLARNYPEYREDYRAAAFNAAEKFPHSAVLAALSVEAGIAAGVPPAPEKLEQTALLLSENGPLSEAALLPVAFCLYALSGALDDMNSAASVKRVDSLYAAFAESLRGTDKPAHTEVRESMLVDAAL
ncbi:MAG: hypothetical protein LBH18_06380, partial [Spirochaetaceae bacterium]|nr:hypothetical protein [Spirochaetaceae bacterium]